jgi:hypothetical protein
MFTKIHDLMMMRPLRRRLSDERGFTMLSAVTSILVGTLLSLAAWQTANSDIRFTDNDRWDKVAYQNAQSGVSDYVQHIAESSSFWSYCDQPPGFTGDGLGQNALNDTDIGSSGHPTRRWLPYSTAGSPTDRAFNGQYTIDLVPQNGATSCKSRTPRSLSMIDQNTASIRVRVTGRAGQDVPPNVADADVEAWRQQHWTRRSTIIELRRNGFLNYGYFTDHESRDPDLVGGTTCDAYYQDDLGDDNGRYRNSGCTELQFLNTDVLKGPFHTNDSVLLQSLGSGGATFGANDGDRIEVYNNGATDCSFRDQTRVNPPVDTDSNCTSTSVHLATNKVRLITGVAAKQLVLPESDDDLLEYADPASGDPDARGYTFYGRTRIRLNNDGTFTVTNALVNSNTATVYPYPTSGVIYVARASGVSSCTSNPDAQFPGIAAGCALIELDGTYNKSLTIGSQDDISILPGGVKKGNTTSVLGLIANDYVRVRHYRYWGSGSSCNTISSETEQTGNTQIDAAILTLSRSFTFDAYSCGSKLGNINLNGSLAQKWRGGVGTTGSSGTGYTKNYVYDYNLRSLAPPHFLSPTTSTWLVARSREQLPACACTTAGP